MNITWVKLQNYIMFVSGFAAYRINPTTHSFLKWALGLTLRQVQIKLSS